MEGWLCEQVFIYFTYIFLCSLKGYIVFYAVMKRGIAEYLTYSIPFRSNKKNWIIQIFNFIINVSKLLLRILLPNWLISDYFKEMIDASYMNIRDEETSKKLINIEEEDKIEKAGKRKEFIQSMNYLNLLIGGGCTLMAILIKRLVGVIPNFCVSFLYLRIISRSYEIISAFLKDVLDSKTNSSLQKGERLKLALNSLLEVGINYSLIYYISSDNFQESFLKSMGTSLLVSVEINNWLDLLHVLTSITLIYLALASYIDGKKVSD